MQFRAEHRSQRLPLHLLQHTQRPHHIHLQGRVQALQLGPQLLVNLDRGGVGGALLSSRIPPGPEAVGMLEWLGCAEARTTTGSNPG